MVKMRHTTLPEHARLIDEMRVFDGGALEPAVGIFWYNPEEDELFDVHQVPISALHKGLRTINVLHKDVWAKAYFRAKAKGKTDSIYFTDYTQIPRGRVFYEPATKQFTVKVGDWIDEYEQLLTPLIKDEFNLTDFRYDIDSHWNIGQGWSEHDF